MAKHDAKQSATPQGVSAPVLAVVDDDPAVCSSLKFSLELEGFAVSIYRGGPEFLSAAEVATFNCLIVDQRMPGMSGMELIERLRARNDATPAILIVSQSSPALTARAAAAGVPMIDKPLLGNALVDAIRNACRHP